MWRIWWAPNNANKWQMGFNSAFKELTVIANLNIPLRFYKERYEKSFKRLNILILFNILMLIKYKCTYISVYICVCVCVCVCVFMGGPGSSVGIAADYGLDGPRSNPGGDEIFRPLRPALGTTQPPVKWVPGLSRGVKCGRGVLLTTHPLLVSQSWKSSATPLSNFWATEGL